MHKATVHGSHCNVFKIESLSYVSQSRQSGAGRRQQLLAAPITNKKFIRIRPHALQSRAGFSCDSLSKLEISDDQQMIASPAVVGVELQIAERLF